MNTRTYRTNVQVGVPTQNKGRIFNREILEGAIREYLASENHDGVFEQPGMEQCFATDEFSWLKSHVVENVFIDDEGYLSVEIRFLDTEHGNVARVMPDMVEISCVMIGFTDWEGKSNVVTEAALINFNLAWKVEEIQLEAA